MTSPAERLTWDQIKQLYPQEWVELVEFDWPEEEPYPRWGVVRSHSPNRAEFSRLLCNFTQPEEIARLFVQVEQASQREYFCPSLMTFQVCKRSP